MSETSTSDRRATRVMFASSAGGHLAQLMRLEPWYRDHDVLWMTFDLPDAVGLLAGRDVVWAHHPTTRSLKNLIRNTWLALKETSRMRPDLVISSGAAIAVPAFYVGKLFGAKTIYVEVVDRIDTRTLTARLVSPVCDLVLAQDESQVRLFPGSHLIGRLL